MAPSVLQLLSGTPPPNSAVGSEKKTGEKRKATKMGGDTKSPAGKALQGDSSTVTPAKDGKKARLASTPQANASRIDAASGKRLQRVVNEAKNKEEERQRAAELLEANKNTFATPKRQSSDSDSNNDNNTNNNNNSNNDDGLGESGDGPGAANNEDGAVEETWSTERHLEVNREAWAEAKEESAAASKGAGPRLMFDDICKLLEEPNSSPASLLASLTRLMRRTLKKATTEEACTDIQALLHLLVPATSIPDSGSSSSQPSLPTLRSVTEAVARAFGPPPPNSPTIDCDDALCEVALEGRRRQRQLFAQTKRSNIGVADISRAMAAIANREKKNVETDAMVKLLGASQHNLRETWYLVRALRGRLGVDPVIVLKALAHAFAPASLLFSSTSAKQTKAKAKAKAAAAKAAEASEGGAEEAKEDAVAADGAGLDEARMKSLLELEHTFSQARAQVGNSMQRLLEVATSINSKAVEAFTNKLLAGCQPKVGTPVIAMSSEKLGASTQVTLEKLGTSRIFAEWNLIGERAQIHVQNKGGLVEVFSTTGKPRPERLEDAEAAIKEYLLKKVDNLILDVIFSRPERKTASKEGGEGSESKEGEGQTPQRVVTVYDLLFKNGKSLVAESLESRRSELEKSLKWHAKLRPVPGRVLEPNSVDNSSDVAMEGTSGLAKAVSKEMDEALAASYLISGEGKSSCRASGLILKSLESSYFAGRSAPCWQALDRPPITGKEADRMLLDLLDDEEKKHIPAKEEFHFTVISGFRTRSCEGIKDILNIQAKYMQAGVSPTWYVDDQCPDEYRKLGLEVVKAGKLIPSRNHALRDADRLRKICVETSDDIGQWCYYKDDTKYKVDEEANAASKRCEQLHVSPVAAAQFLAAKMRARGEGKCNLGGVYPLSNAGRAMRAEAFSRKNFILGDFFVAERGQIRFDEELSLKEDYDFTCSHLEQTGEVLRANRLLITAKHETNAGGACAIRDPNGERERYNIAILKRKWPGAIQDHPTRANQVVLRWTSLKRQASEEGEEGGEGDAEMEDA